MKRKFYHWYECINLQEVKENNLYQTMRERKRYVLEEDIRGLLSQLVQGLAHIHRNRYFHRDLKPENLLVMNDTMKIADFGLAREVSSVPPFTDYVSTRWYRAPEVLLQSCSYTPAIDMWAVGAILAELFTLCPIFPGESEIDQLHKICCVLGTPDWTAFPEARNIFRLVDISYLRILPVNLSDVIPNASMEAIDLIQAGIWIPRSLGDPLQMKLSNDGSEPNLELNLWDFGMERDACFLGLTLAVNPTSSRKERETKDQASVKDMLLCSGFQDCSQQSVVWSLLPSDQHGILAPVKPSLSLSFSSVQQGKIGLPYTT
ncbi:unnamed protein product [Cuscuta epithymum]|uniref:Protein kinase domain-containing protein n=1 Tax=Cuscuta epithymum TaxID=186058 RepID=A0AAV0CCR5_9ASTE|nr:unnamed protein product [Cuscuta epithymum]CAH9138730.1 unnamed protein product [Cuscuta epithymum]